MKMVIPMDSEIFANECVPVRFAAHVRIAAALYYAEKKPYLEFRMEEGTTERVELSQAVAERLLNVPGEKVSVIIRVDGVRMHGSRTDYDVRITLKDVDTFAVKFCKNP